MSNYPLYNRLESKSRKRWWQFVSNPQLLSKASFRYDLIKRLSQETGMSEDETYKALYKELVKFVKEHSLNL